jgi:GAF domain-containing protein
VLAVRVPANPDGWATPEKVVIGMTEPSRSSRGRTSKGQRARPGTARDLGEVARSFDAEPDPANLLQMIADGAKDNIPGATGAGITVHEAGKFTSVAITEPFVLAIDELQYQHNEGPCLSALRDHATVRVDDMAAESRWPQFSREAAQRGVGAMLSFQLYVERSEIGALNLYARSPGAFDDESEEVGLLFATHAAIALASAQAKANLRIAIATRDLIGQAKGILMERYKITDEQAFQLLVHRSQQSHSKLREVAETLTTTGDFILD